MATETGADLEMGKLYRNHDHVVEGEQVGFYYYNSCYRGYVDAPNQRRERPLPIRLGRGLLLPTRIRGSFDENMFEESGRVCRNNEESGPSAEATIAYKNGHLSFEHAHHAPPPGWELGARSYRSPAPAHPHPRLAFGWPFVRGLGAGAGGPADIIAGRTTRPTRPLQ